MVQEEALKMGITEFTTSDGWLDRLEICEKLDIKTHFFHFFLVSDTQLYKRLCPSVCWSVSLFVMIELKSEKTNVLDTFSVHLCVGVGIGLWMGAGRPSPPVRDNIVTPHHLFYFTLSYRSFLY